MTYPPASLARILIARMHRTNRRNNERAIRRRELYRSDPVWRLTKLKDNRERRLRARIA